MEARKFINHLRAGFSAFWLRTHEPNRVKASIYKQLTDVTLKDNSHYSIMEWNCIEEPNPMAVLTTFDEAEDLSVLFLYNFHWYIDKPPVIQKIQSSLPVWANAGKAIVVVSAVEKIPVELQKNFVLIDLPLPKEDEIKDIINHVAPSKDFVPGNGRIKKIVEASKGLTRQELESVLALSLVENKEFDPSTINDYKATAIAKTGFLDVLKPTVTFQDVIGYEELKGFVLDTIDNPKAKGIMTIGPPGCGKTSLMKAIVAETGKFGLSINMGKLFSKWQGETDQNINSTIELIESIGNCFVLIDEFEKQFAGAGSDGNMEGSGTTRRATGRWLEFLQDRPNGIYICGTANSFRGIPGEYLRPGRWDTSPFFIDLPSPKVRLKILAYYIKKHGLKETNLKPKMDSFSGAEIEALCHIADMRGMTLIEASGCILPQALTMEENVKALREWAKGRTIPAEKIPLVNPTLETKRRLGL